MTLYIIPATGNSLERLPAICIHTYICIERGPDESRNSNKCLHTSNTSLMGCIVGATMG